MKKFFKFLMIIIMLPIFIVIGAITYLKFADLNPYKPKIESLLQKYANLGVKINGNLDVGISFKPSVEIKDVAVFNPDNGEDIAKIGKALVQISILPLFQKEIVVDVIEMNDMDVYTGKSESIKINAAELTMDDYKSPIKATFLTTVSGINIDGMLTLSSLQQIQTDKYDRTDVLTTINALGYTLDFNGNVSGLQDKIKADGSYNIKYKSNNIKGNISVGLTDNVPFVKLDANSESINITEFKATKQANNNWFISSANAASNDVFKIPYEYFKMVNADISFNLKKIIIQPDLIIKEVNGDAHTDNGVFKANIKKAVYENNTITGSAELKSEKVLPYINLTINGEAIDLTKLSNTKKADSTWLIKSAQASQLMNNIAIPYQYLRMANGKLSLTLKSLIPAPDVKMSNIQAQASLNNGLLTTNIKNITAGDGTANGTITLNANSKSLNVDLNGSNIILQKLYTPYSNPGNPHMYVKSGGKINFLIKVNTFGNNTDQYLGNLNGQIIAFMDNSVLKIKSLERLQGNIIVQVLNAVKISDITKKDMDLSCAVMRSDIKDGRANFPKGIAFNATDFYLVADGSLNLKNDKLNFELQPFSGKLDSTNISSILGSLLKITGTVNSPKININQTSAAKNVVGFLASGGAYNVGDMMLSTDNAPCHTALLGTPYASYFKADTSLKGNVSKSYTDVKNNIKDVGKNIKSAGKDIKNQAKELGNQLKGLFKK